jgi:hydrogenase maturation protease
VAAAVAAGGPADVEVVEHDGEPIELVEMIGATSELWIVDAVCSGAQAGLLHRLDAAAGPLPAALFGVSTHRIGLADALELARALGRLPPRVVVHGVEGRDFEPGATLSAPVARAADRLAGLLLEQLAGRAPAAADAAEPPPVTPRSR